VATRDLVMLNDEDEDEKEDTKNIAIVISDRCMLNGNVITIPLNEALSIAANINIQIAMLI